MVDRTNLRALVALAVLLELLHLPIPGVRWSLLEDAAQPLSAQPFPPAVSFAATYVLLARCAMAALGGRGRWGFFGLYALVCGYAIASTLTNFVAIERALLPTSGHLLVAGASMALASLATWFLADWVDRAQGPVRGLGVVVLAHALPTVVRGAYVGGVLHAQPLSATPADLAPLLVATACGLATFVAVRAPSEALPRTLRGDLVIHHPVGWVLVPAGLAVLDLEGPVAAALGAAGSTAPVAFLDEVLALAGGLAVWAVAPKPTAGELSAALRTKALLAALAVAAVGFVPFAVGYLGGGR